MNITFNKKILCSVLLYQFVFINNNFLIAGETCAQLNIDDGSTFTIPNGCSSDQETIQIINGSKCIVGDNTFIGTNGLCINQEYGGSQSNVDGFLTVNRDGSLLNNNSLSLKSNAVVITTGLFVSQIGNSKNETQNSKTFVCESGSKLYCGAFPISLDGSSGRWTYAKAASTGTTISNDISIDFWRDSAGNEGEDYQNRGGIINGLLYNSSNTVDKFYKYDEANNKVIQTSYDSSIYSFNPSDSRVSDDSTFISSDGMIVFNPGATFNGINIDNSLNITTENPNIEAQIKRGTINLKNYLKLSSSEIQANNDNNFSDKKGHLLKGHFLDAKIQLFDENKNKDNNNIEIKDKTSKLLTINSSIDGSETNKTLFNNLTFTNCFAEIPYESGYLYEAKNEVESNTAETKIVALSNLNNKKRALNENIYKLRSRDNYNNYLQVSKLFSSSARNYTYHGLLDADNKLNKLYEYDYTNKKIKEYKYDTSGNTTEANEYTYDDEINPPNSAYTIKTINSDTLNANNKNKVPVDGLILRNKHGSDKLTFSQLFNNYCEYNCYIDLNNLTEVAKDNNTNLTLDDISLSVSTNTYNKDIYIQLSGSKNVLISNLYDNTLRLILKNPWTDSLPTHACNYTGNFTRKLNIYTTDNIKNKYSKDDLYDDYYALLSDTDKSTYDNTVYDNTKRDLLLKTKLSIEYLSELYSKYSSNFSDDQKTEYEGQLLDNNKAKYLLEQLSAKSNEIYTYLLELEKNKNNNNCRLTQIYQDYDGPAFNNYKLNFTNTNDSNGNKITDTNTVKSSYVYSEILDYRIGTAPTSEVTISNFSAHSATDASKPFVVDKFTIGYDQCIAKLNVNSDNTTIKTNILTQHFTVSANTTYKLNGHISVKTLKKKDFDDNSASYNS